MRRHVTAWSGWARFAVVALFVGVASHRIDGPGFFYDEVLFVNAALGGIDDSFVHQRIWGVPTMLMPYLGALKSWLHAPIFALFGVSPETVRIPSVWISAASLFLLARLGERLLGRTAGFWFLLVLATDPRLLMSARIDYGPVVLMTFFKSLALVLLFSWLDAPRFAKLLGLLSTLALGVFDKLNFVWFVVALAAGVAVVYPREAWSNLRQDGARSISTVAIFAAICVVVAVGTVLPLLRADLPYLQERGSGWSLARLGFVADLVSGTLLGPGLWQLLFSSPPPAGTALSFDQLVTSPLVWPVSAPLLLLLAGWDRVRGRDRSLAFIVVLSAVIVAEIVSTRQATMPHHAFILYPLHLLIAFLLVVRCTRRLPDAWIGPARGLLGFLIGVVLVLQVRADAVYLRRIEDPGAFRGWCSPAILELSARIRELEPDRVVSADWGLHTQLFSLAHPEERSRFVDQWAVLEDAGVLEPERAKQLRDRYFAGRRVLVVMHTPDETAMPAARKNFLAFRATMLGDSRPPEILRGATGEPLYELYVIPRS